MSTKTQKLTFDLSNRMLELIVVQSTDVACEKPGRADIDGVMARTTSYT